MKNCLTLLILLFSCCAYAQYPPQAGTAATPGRFIISAGGGTTLQQQAYLKDSAFMGNGPSISGDIFASLWQWQYARNNVSLGLSLGGDYAMQQTGSIDFVKDHYRLSGGTISPTSPEGEQKGRVLAITLAPRLYWRTGGFFVAPALQVGYLSLQRNGFSVIDSLEDAGGRKRAISFYTADKISASGLTLSPQLKVGYQVSKTIALWTSAQYITGPGITTHNTYWKPYGDPVDGTYTFGQYVEGKPATRTTEAKYSAMSLQGGLSVSLGGKQRTSPALPKESYSEIPATENTITKKDTSSREKKRASAPRILSPNFNTVAGTKDGFLQFHYVPSDFPYSKTRVVIWKLNGSRREKVFDNTYTTPWNGTVNEKYLKADKNDTSVYEAQLTASYHPVVPGKTGGNNTLLFSKSTVPVYDNNGESNIARFTMQNNCTVDHTFVLDSTQCLEDDKIRVYGHVAILPNSAGVTSGTISFTAPFLETTSNTQVTPSGFQPGASFTVTQANTSFSFEMDGDMCNKQLRVFYNFSYQCPSLNTPAVIPCADTIALPCCLCTYCDDPQNMNITEGAQTVNQLNAETMAITQQFNISPKNIIGVKAQIVYISESSIDDACRTCAKDESSVYHFTGSNTAQWNGGNTIQGVAQNGNTSFPSRIIGWSSNTQGNLALNMQVGLPGLSQLECCSRSIRICIRYSFTDKDCKTCERLVCYEGVQLPKQ